MMKDTNTTAFEFNKLNLASLLKYIQHEDSIQAVTDNFSNLDSLDKNTSNPEGKIQNLLSQLDQDLQISYGNSSVMSLPSLLQKETKLNISKTEDNESNLEKFRRIMNENLQDGEEETENLNLSELIEKFESQKMSKDFDYYIAK